MNLITFDEFRNVKNDVDWRNINNINYGFVNDVDLREPFLRYVLIEFFADVFSRDAIDMLYNKYFWFSYFIFEYEEKLGEHSELLQQQFRILEQIEDFDLLDLKWLELIKHNPKKLFEIKDFLY